MKDALDVEERSVLVEARAQLAPTREQTDRVFGATRRALLETPAGNPSPGGVAPPPVFAPPPMASNVRKSLAMLACVAAAAALIAYFAQSREPPPAPLPRAAQHTAGETAVARRAAPEAPGTVAANPSDLGPPDAGAKTQQPRSRRSTRVLPAAPLARADDPADLDLELRVLRRVERALRDDAPRRALSLLVELERRVPGGQLREERLAAETVARCTLDSASAPALLGQFTARHPASVYLPRVKQSCTTVRAFEESKRELAAPDNQY